MSKIHLVLQGKGGVGKSLIAAILAQYKAKNGQKPLCIDIDPVNKTFAGYKALDVHLLTIMEGDKSIPQSFDALMELMASPQNDVIIDSGTSSFVPLFYYMSSNQVQTRLKTMGHELIIHTIITGGQARDDTVRGFMQLIGQFPKDCLFVVWLNPYFGPIEYEGKGFEQMKTYIDNKDRISAIVPMQTLNEATYGRDFADMLQAHLTFDEVLAIPSFTIMTRQRLKIIQRELFNRLDIAVVV